MSITVKPFHGRMDRREDPRDVVENVEAAVRRDYSNQLQQYPQLRSKKTMASEPDEEVLAIYDDMQLYARALFRAAMADKADLWFRRLDRSIRNDWDRLREVFLTRFQLPEENHLENLSRMDDLFASMKQGPGENIHDYLDRADDFNAQYSTEKPHFGIKVVQGLLDDSKRELLLFFAKQKKDREYGTIRRLIMDAYTGLDNPFVDPHAAAQPIVSHIANSDETFRQAMPTMLKDIQTLLSERAPRP